MWGWWILAGFGSFLVAVVLYDVMQTRHAILHNFPIIGHFRYILEAVGPELRQYIVTNNDEERPFSRDQRRWVYASAKQQNNYFGFGTDNDLERNANYLIIKHAAFPLPERIKGHPLHDPKYGLPCAKVLGGARGRVRAFRPRSIVNVSAMSYGSLSGRAVEAMNRGVAIAGALHNTGEGGISPYHNHSGELIWQIGTSYFGCRDPEGNFSLERLKENLARYPVRALEIKLSQGAKPAKGGILPAAKISEEIAAIRGIPMGRDCISPNGHSAFNSVDAMLDFVEMLGSETGLPVGIKSAVGEHQFWVDLADQMESGERGVDFITIDGGEGGTGAAPLAYTDHVSLPFKLGMSRVYKEFAKRGIHERIVWVGSGRLGFPEMTLFAFSLGCDMVHVAREAMLSIGCIQAQRCHTGECPTGVATQSAWLMRGLDPMQKSARLANYLVTLRHDVLALARACGEPHPSFITRNHLEVLDDCFGARSVADLFNYEPTWGYPSAADQQRIRELMDMPPDARELAMRAG